MTYTSSAWKQSDLGGATQQQHEEGEFIKSFVAIQNTRDLGLVATA